MRKASFGFYCFIICCCTSCAVTVESKFTPQKKYSPQQLKEDVQALEVTLKRNHPSLYWYSSKAQIEASFERAYQLASDSMNENAFKNLIAETVFPIRCGHTSVRNSEQWSNYYEGKLPQGFPLNLKIADDSTLIITNNFNRRDSVLKRGMVIESINGLSSTKIIDSLLPMVAIDGNAKNFSYQNISNNFQLYYNSRFSEVNKFTIEFIDYNGGKQTTSVSAIQFNRDSARRQLNNSTVPTKSLPAPSIRERRIQAIRSFTIDTSGKYAVLRINSFTRYLKKSFIRHSFKTLINLQVPDLIIDLRNNGGGLISHSLFLARYLKNKPFYYTDSIYSKTRTIHASVKVKRKFFTNIGMLLLNRKVNDHLFQFAFFKKRYQPKKKSYRGKVFVLTGGFSFSATTMLLSALKGQENIVLVGEETGGGYYGNNGVFIPEMTLPNTKLRIRMPLYRIVNNKLIAKNGKGVLPDVYVKATSESIRRNTDPKMEKAIELIKLHQ